MRQGYVNDYKLILKIQGLRVISKEDMVHSLKGGTVYRLRWDYKGSLGYMDYEDVNDRDIIFNKIVAAITSKEESINDRKRNP